MHCSSCGSYLKSLCDRSWYLIPLHMVTVSCLLMAACPELRHKASRSMRRMRRRMR